ncbi:hypothetical protein NE237_021959 [Protea cynaroides]|uniref:Uncharacterized protein n=1 Tax=Protea cynaroides TaxID=273540 RepID=A0A9Q0HE86_9MAGN|nr:hypothetical protein NE237_021959 [Protea cynaroides]
MPFPQDKNHTVSYTTGSQEHKHQYPNHVYFIPNSSFASLSEDDKAPCCCFNYVTNLKPRELDRNDSCLGRPYGYVAIFVAPDGFPPRFLARKGLEVYATSYVKVKVSTILFEHIYQNLTFHLVQSFHIYKGRRKVEISIKRSMFYEITLKQQCKQIYECANNLNDHNFVVVDVSVQREVALLFGTEALHNHTNVTEEVIYRVGLNSTVLERMRWEEERVGWVGGKERKKVRLKRIEELRGKYGWKKYGCYVQVEVCI